MAYEKFKRLWAIWEGFRASRCRATEVPPKKQSPEALPRTPPTLHRAEEPVLSPFWVEGLFCFSCLGVSGLGFRIVLTAFRVLGCRLFPSLLKLW